MEHLLAMVAAPAIAAVGSEVAVAANLGVTGELLYKAEALSNAAGATDAQVAVCPSRRHVTGGVGTNSDDRE